MHNYDTLSEAVEDLKKKGFTYDFELLENEVGNPKDGKKFPPEHFTVTDTYRFEGPSSTDDSSVLYVIETDTGLKGTLVDAYGAYSGQTLSREMIKRLAMRK